MIYDGFATSDEVDRLDHNRLVRLYELYDVTETTVLEVVHAHLDVLRYRKLVEFAEEVVLHGLGVGKDQMKTEKWG